MKFIVIVENLKKYLNITKKIKRMIGSKVSIVVPSGKKGGDNIKHAEINS